MLVSVEQSNLFLFPQKTSALAYASFCQLDEINRPIAGQVNFCPRNVKSQKFDEELLYIVSFFLFYFCETKIYQIGNPVPAT